MSVILDDEELVHVTLKGFCREYGPFCSALRTRSEGLTFEQFFSMLSCEELFLKNSHDSYKDNYSMAMLTNAAFRPPFLKIHPSFYQNPGKGNEEEVLTNVEDVAYTSISPITPISLLNTNNNNSGQNQTQALGQNRTEGTRPTSQICGKSRHTALDCYNKMDFSYQRKHPPVKLAAMASA